MEQTTNDKLVNITIPSPSKDYVTLFSWLLANASKDMCRPALTYIKIGANHTCWAVNGYTMVRVEICTDLIDWIEPCLYEVISCTNKLIHMIPVPDCRYPGVEELYNSYVPKLDEPKLSTFDPALLIPIIKPFETVIMHARKSGIIMLALKEPKALPRGIYSAILMGKSLNTAEENFSAIFPSPVILASPEPTAENSQSKEQEN